MNPPQVYMCSPSWTLLPPPSPFHPSGSSQCTSPKHPVSCIKPGLATRFIHDILHVSMPFSQIYPPSPSPTESILSCNSTSMLYKRFFKNFSLVSCICMMILKGTVRVTEISKWLSGKESVCQHRRYGFDPWVRKIPWRRKRQPTPVFLHGQSHGERSLKGYSP